MDEHCKDCCCARSWAALGVTENTGKSIVEHIGELRASVARVEDVERLAKVVRPFLASYQTEADGHYVHEKIAAAVRHYVLGEGK